MIPAYMRALVKETAGRGLTLMQVRTPVPQIGDVLIKIHKTAICGTDVHIYNWDDWSQRTIVPPMIVGHEYVGEIAALGPGVDDYHVGQIVTGEGHIVCGHCRNCRAGNGHWCKFTKGVRRQPKRCVCRVSLHSGDQRHRRSIHLAGGVSLRFTTHMATPATRQRCFDVTGEDVLITGAGPIGVMAVGICRQNGARRIVVTDVNDYRLALAKKMGASATVNLNNQTV